MNKLALQNPLLSLWIRSGIPINFVFQDEKEDKKCLLLEAEILFRIQEEWSTTSLLGRIFLQDLTRYYLEADMVIKGISATPEGLEFWLRDRDSDPDPDLDDLDHDPDHDQKMVSNACVNGYYSYTTQKIILFPFSENYKFTDMYLHELIHALEDTYCELQCVKDVIHILKQHKHTEVKGVVQCVLMLLDIQTSCYPNESEWTWSLFLQEDPSLQDEDGSFLHDTIFLELSAFSFEYLAQNLNQFGSMKRACNKLNDDWQQRKHKAVQCYTGETHSLACRVIYASMDSLSRKLFSWSQNRSGRSPRWIKCLKYFQMLLQTEFQKENQISN